MPAKIQPNNQKETELYEFAYDFNAAIMQTTHTWPNIEFVTSLCLPKYDRMNQIGIMGKKL